MRFTRAALVAGVLACATAAPASATDNGATYNNPFTTGDLSDCVFPKARTGISAFAFDGAPVPFTLDARAPWPGCEHAPGSIRVLKLQALNVGGQVTYLTRGGTAEGEAFPGEPHVHIPATALRRVPKLLEHTQRNTNGRSAPNCSRPITARPTALPEAMKYKPRQATDSGASWANYGDPGARFDTSYTYMLWNLPRRDDNGAEGYVKRGGILMTTIRPGQRLLVCDVSQQLLDSFAPGGARINGWAQWVYAQAQNGAERVHGWVLVRAHHDGTTYTLFS